MRLEARHLEVLLAIEREGSVSAAARALGTAQPHVSRTLARVEQALGTVVFDRGVHGVVPTAEGRRVLEHARSVIADIHAVEAPGPASRREVRLLCFGLNAALLVARLRETRPDLDVSLAWVDPQPAYREVAQGTADFFVGYRSPHIVWSTDPRLVELEIVSDPIVVFLPESHRLAGEEVVDLADLADDDWLLGEDPLNQQAVLTECRNVGGFEPRARYVTDEGTLIRSIIESGLAVTLGSSVARRGPGFVARPYRDATPATWLLVCRGDRVGDDAVVDVRRSARHVYDSMRAAAAESEGT
jgi:DNA-binding transcriptional LysR family regulator